MDDEIKKMFQPEFLTCKSCARFSPKSGGCNGMGAVHPDPCDFWLPLDYCFAEGAWLYIYENGILTRKTERTDEDVNDEHSKTVQP